MRFLTLAFYGLFFVSSVAGGTAAVHADILSGVFNNAPMKTQGKWYLDTRSDGVYAIFPAGFETVKGPNLHMYLSKESAADVGGAMADGDLHIGALKKYRGSQLYKLPKGTKLEDYKSFAIVCDQFHKLWVAGDLWTETRS